MRTHFFLLAFLAATVCNIFALNPFGSDDRGGGYGSPMFPRNHERYGRYSSESDESRNGPYLHPHHRESSSSSGSREYPYRPGHHHGSHSSSSSSSGSDESSGSHGHHHPACSKCSQLEVITDSGIGIDQPITFTTRTDSNGCRKIIVECTSKTPGADIHLFWSNNGEDFGTSLGLTSVTKELECNTHRELILKDQDAGVNGIVDQVECISVETEIPTEEPEVPTESPTLECAKCGEIEVIIDTDKLPITQTIATDDNGCTTVTVKCDATSKTNKVQLFWFVNGEDKGMSADETFTISRTLTCNADAELVFFENEASRVVDQVYCLST